MECGCFFSRRYFIFWPNDLDGIRELSFQERRSLAAQLSTINSTDMVLAYSLDLFQLRLQLWNIGSVIIYFFSPLVPRCGNVLYDVRVWA